MYGTPGVGGYDRALTIFSPQGNLFQVEYAREAVKKGGLAIAIKFKDGVLFGTQKTHSSKLLVQESLNKIFRIDENAVVVFSGMAGDARKLLTFSRERAEEHRLVYGEEIGIKEIVKDVADVVQLYTQYGGVRPYGVTFIIGGFQHGEVSLSEIPPDGNVVGVSAWAIGHNSDDVRSFLEKNYKEGLSKEGAMNLFLQAVKKSDGKKTTLNASLLELATISKSSGFKRFSTEEISSFLKKA